MSVPNSDAVQCVFDILKVVAGGVLASAISLWVSGRRHDQDRHRAARHLSIRLIDLFERYAVECADAISNNRDNRRDNPYDSSGIAFLPVIGDLPQDDAGWRGLEPSFAIEAQTFGNQIQAGRSFIRGAADYGDADDVEEEVNKQAVLLGNSAWHLASSLRAKYALPIANPVRDLAGVFRDEEERQRQIQLTRTAENSKLWADEISEQDAMGAGDSAKPA